MKYFYFYVPGIYILFLLLVQWFSGLAHVVHKVCFSPLCVFKCVLKLSALMDVYWHWLHCFAFSHKLPAWEYWYSHWTHLFDFPPVCVIKCLLILLAWEDAKSHRLHLFDFASLCFFKCSIELFALKDVFWHCICLTFLYCALLTSPQIACLRGYKITLVTFVWLFSAVFF